MMAHTLYDILSPLVIAAGWFFFGWHANYFYLLRRKKYLIIGRGLSINIDGKTSVTYNDVPMKGDSQATTQEVQQAAE